ncbi:hypothetical protein C8R44DRAFT_728902 [Mycena epipterygia]|nr:hypothetical protein C8R44DRAFT_728902 [Mycena epipterygia]
MVVAGQRKHGVGRRQIFWADKGGMEAGRPTEKGVVGRRARRHAGVRIAFAGRHTRMFVARQRRRPGMVVARQRKNGVGRRQIFWADKGGMEAGRPTEKGVVGRRARRRAGGMVTIDSMPTKTMCGRGRQATMPLRIKRDGILISAVKRGVGWARGGQLRDARSMRKPHALVLAPGVSDELLAKLTCDSQREAKVRKIQGRWELQPDFNHAPRKKPPSVGHSGWPDSASFSLNAANIPALISWLMIYWAVSNGGWSIKFRQRRAVPSSIPMISAKRGLTQGRLRCEWQGVFAIRHPRSTKSILLYQKYDTIQRSGHAYTTRAVWQIRDGSGTRCCGWNESFAPSKPTSREGKCDIIRQYPYDQTSDGLLGILSVSVSLTNSTPLQDTSLKVYIPNPQGCVNDMEIFKSFLCKYQETPESHIRFLANSGAMREAINTGFMSHLIENPDIQPIKGNNSMSTKLKFAVFTLLTSMLLNVATGESSGLYRLLAASLSRKTRRQQIFCLIDRPKPDILVCESRDADGDTSNFSHASTQLQNMNVRLDGEVQLKIMHSAAPVITIPAGSTEYHFEVTNNSQRPIYFYLFHFDLETYDIQTLNHWEQERPCAPGTSMLLVQENNLRFTAVWPDGDIGVLKLFATQSRVILEMVAQISLITPDQNFLELSGHTKNPWTGGTLECNVTVKVPEEQDTLAVLLLGIH